MVWLCNITSSLDRVKYCLSQERMLNMCVSISVVAYRLESWLYASKNRPVACKGSRMQSFFNCGYVTAGCCGCLYKCIASNGKSVIHCILTYAVVKVYGTCSFCKH